VDGKLAVGPMAHCNASRFPFHAASVIVEIKYSWVGTRLWRGRRSEETLHLLKMLHVLRGLLIFMREKNETLTRPMATHEGIRRAPRLCVDLPYFALPGQNVRRYQPNINTARNPFKFGPWSSSSGGRNLTTTLRGDEDE
jgi:hypothetical protein